MCDSAGEESAGKDTLTFACMDQYIHLWLQLVYHITLCLVCVYQCLVYLTGVCISECVCVPVVVCVSVSWLTMW